MKRTSTNGISYLLPLLMFLLDFAGAQAQDSVEVTFRYKPATTNPSIVFVPGEFNGWGPNSSGTISPGAPSRMEWEPSSATWKKSVWLRIGFPGTPPKGVAGAYQYKFNEDGTKWLADPLNPRVNSADAGNSYLYPADPTIYQFIPNQVSGVVKTSRPVISAYLFPKAGGAVDTSTIAVKIDATLYSSIGSSYDPTRKQLSFQVPDPLVNGTHRVWLYAGSVSDSVTIIVQAGAVQITSLGNFVTRKSSRTLFGSVEDTSIHSVRLTRNGSDTVTATVTAGQFSALVSLVEGENVFRALLLDAAGALQFSDPVTFTYVVDHGPNADFYAASAGPNVVLNGLGSSDPDPGQSSQLKYRWLADVTNPQSTPAVNDATTAQVTMAAPSAKGDYFYTLIVEDPDGNRDTTRNYFTVLSDGSIEGATLATSPRWAKQGRLYEMFFKSMTPQGTIRAAMPYLPYLKSLGINIIWVMPVMENASPMNNQSGTGYNIKNFFKVAPEYGTNDDFKEFVRQAHAAGLRVILDVTPNHTSHVHPFAVEAKQYGRNSPYWDFYQHTIIPHNTNGLGQSMTSDGFVYYSGFSSQLLNYNWSDLDARAYMTEVYKWWVREFDIDGYRFDVYWGPHRRAAGGAGNELEMGVPVRKALKKIKPDIFLLAEDDGTGIGTEVIYGDRSGGVDAGYDWVLYGGAVKPFAFDAGAIENLHTRFYNSNFYPGLNALFMRFMENHDEERVVVVSNYGSYVKTMPMATTLFTMPGLPLIYSGQEVGFGLGISDYDQRRRGVIDWSAGGKSILMPHYQRLATIRSQYATFSSQKLLRLASGNSSVYAYLRPSASGDGIVAANFSSLPQQLQLTFSSQAFESPTLEGKTYFLNDVYNDTSFTLTIQNGIASIAARLGPYGSLICMKSDSLRHLLLPPLVSVNEEEERETPTTFRLFQNFPNPFNPSTTIKYALPAASLVRLEICDVLGRVAGTLANLTQQSGSYTVQWNAGSYPSGIYFCRLTTEPTGSGKGGRNINTIKMLLLK